MPDPEEIARLVTRAEELHSGRWRSRGMQDPLRRRREIARAVFELLRRDLARAGVA